MEWVVTSWNIVLEVLKIIGGLGVFIFGMKVLSDGLQKAAGERLQRFLNMMTGKPLPAIGTGVAVTTLLQSSSATTVMVVSVVNAGILSLAGAIGVIMGANIGTTMTAWIISAFGYTFKVSTFALPIIAIGLPLLLNSKFKNKGVAEALVGFGILFIGLGFLKESLATPEVKDFITSFISSIDLGDFYLLQFPVFVLLGTLLTFLVQSSSAAMAITLGLMSIGALTFEQGAMIVLGENIGTTITAFLASLGANANAKRASRVHIIFNVIGVLWMMAAFPFFVSFVRAVIRDGSVILGNPDFLLFQLSLFHTAFNITNTFLLAWFMPQLEQLAIWMVPGEEGKIKDSLKLLDGGYQETTEAYVFEARLWVGRLLEKTLGMFQRFGLVLKDQDEDAKAFFAAQQEDENQVDAMEEEISIFLSEISAKELSPSHHNEVSQMIRIVAELETMADDCFNLAVLWKKKSKRALIFTKEVQEEIFVYMEQISNFLRFIKGRINKPMESGDFDQASVFEQAIFATQKSLVKGARKRLQEGANVRLELIFLDLTRHMEHISEQSMEIANCLRTLASA
jgi:phosphate:Na+ symporter